MDDPAYYMRELEKSRFLRNLSTDDCVETIVQALREQRLRVQIRIARRMRTRAKLCAFNDYAKVCACWVIDRDLQVARGQLSRVDDALHRAGAK